MGKKKDTLVIHSGKCPFQLSKTFFTSYQYMWADTDYLKFQGLPAVFEDGKFNQKYINDYFILDKTSSWLNKPTILAQLPDNQVIYSNGTNLSQQTKNVLEMIGAFGLNFGDNLSNLRHDINTYFFKKNIGYQILIDKLNLQKSFLSKIKIMGYSYYEIDCNLGHTWTYLGNLSNSVYLPQGIEEDIKIEVQELASVELKVEAYCFSSQNHHLIKKITQTGSFLHNYHFVIKEMDESAYFQLAFYVRGKGQLRLGTIHIHASRGPYGILNLGAKGIVDKKGLGGEVNYVFNAGDLKPPLVVMFAGHNTADVFEGEGMMRRIGCPYLLITDSRYGGGGFYIGSAEFENKIVNIINFYQVKLGFRPKDLVITGISMGAFGALYYGAQVCAGTILAAKIIVNLGTVAANSKIKRPLDFNEANDIVLVNERNTDNVALNRINNKLWDKFNLSDLSHTDFILGYMENEDYDTTGYSILRKYLKKNYPAVHVLAKSFWGRHNDNTEIVDWFVQQVNHVVNIKYRQKYHNFDIN